MNQRAKMIQEINSFVDGSSMANPMMMMGMMGMGMGMNPAMNPMMNAAVMQAPIQNPHMMIFNPLVTEDYKIAKVMEINSRLLEWKGVQGFFEIGGSMYYNNNNNNSQVNY